MTTSDSRTLADQLVLGCAKEARTYGLLVTADGADRRQLGDLEQAMRRIEATLRNCTSAESVRALSLNPTYRELQAQAAPIQNRLTERLPLVEAAYTAYEDRRRTVRRALLPQLEARTIEQLQLGRTAILYLIQTFRAIGAFAADARTTYPEHARIPGDLPTEFPALQHILQHLERLLAAGPAAVPAGVIQVRRLAHPRLAPRDATVWRQLRALPHEPHAEASTWPPGEVRGVSAAMAELLVAVGYCELVPPWRGPEPSPDLDPPAVVAAYRDRVRATAATTEPPPAA